MVASLRTPERREGFAYKLGGVQQYGLDVAISGDLQADENTMSLWIPFADGNRRDGVGDLLEIGGIDLSRHRRNPLVLFDHGKEVALPIAKNEDDKTGAYTVELRPEEQTAGGRAFFYQGTGMGGCDRDQEYEHAILCEQLFDLACKRFIRAGSIGYQVIEARKIPSQRERGIPEGNHLIRVLMLENSLVVLPANADTVVKVLAMPTVAGKRLSPYLVKSFNAMKTERPTSVGFVKVLEPPKGPVSALRPRAVSYANVDVGMTVYARKILIKYRKNPQSGFMEQDGVFARTGDPLKVVAVNIPHNKMTVRNRAGDEMDEVTFLMVRVKSLGGAMGLKDLRQQYRKKRLARQRKSVEAARAPKYKFVVGCRHGGKSHSFEVEAGSLDEAVKAAPGLARKRGLPASSVKRVKRSGAVEVKAMGNPDVFKGILQRLRPGDSKVIAGRRVQRYSPPRDPRFAQDKVQFSIDGGDWVGIDEAANTLASQTKGAGNMWRADKAWMKDGEQMPPAGVDTDVPAEDVTTEPPTDDVPAEEPVEEPVEEAKSDDMGEPFGAQVLRRCHKDAALLMEEYDKYMKLLDHEGVKGHLQGHLENLEKFMSDTEGLFGKGYKDLPPLEGADLGEDKDFEDVDPDLDTDEGKEFDPMDDDVVPASSGGEEIEEEGDGAEEKALVAKLKQLRAKRKSLPSGQKGIVQTGKTSMGIAFAQEGKYKVTVDASGTVRKQIRQDTGHWGVWNPSVHGEFPPDILQKLTDAAKKVASGKSLPDVTTEPPTDDVPADEPATKGCKALDDREADLVSESAKFLKDLAEPTSQLDDEGRMKSYHYHKTLEGMAQVRKMADDAETDAGGMEQKELPAEEGITANPGADPEVLEGASKLFKGLSAEKAFGNAHREECGAVAKALGDMVGRRGAKEEGLDDDLKEMDETTPEETAEATFDTDGLKALFERQQKQMAALNRSLQALRN